MELLVDEINTFTKIAYENLEISKDYRKRANEADSVDDHTALIIEGRKYAMITIVFSAMALEAYINNYAARKRSINFFEKYLDNLDFVKKWVVISEFFTGEQFPVGESCYERLDELKRRRNALVHSKTKSLNLTDSDAVKQQGEKAYEIFSQAQDAVDTISMVVKCLVKMDPEEYRYLNSISATVD